MKLLLSVFALFPIFVLADAPESWQIGFQDPATPVMQGIIDLHHDIMFFMLVILVFCFVDASTNYIHFSPHKKPYP